VIVIGHSSIVGDFSQSANGIHGLFEIWVLHWPKCGKKGLSFLSDNSLSFVQ
jgi:hypothetical protein